MCTLLIAIDRHPDYPWVIAANRDEYRDRPTAPLAWWKDRPDLLAGRDLSAGGTWMGVTRAGRFAALTNFRDACCVYPRGPSRGFLVSDFLTGDTTPLAYLEKIAAQGQRYDGFNLVVGEIRSGMYYYGNRPSGCSADCSGNIGCDAVGVTPRRLAPGIYGLSNHRIDTPWPKVERGKALFSACLSATGNDLDARLFEALADTTQPVDAELPDTGVGLAWERILAPLFINSPHYGTRSCSVVRLDRHDHLTIVERTPPQPEETGRQPVDRRFRFRVTASQPPTPEA